LTVILRLNKHGLLPIIRARAQCPACLCIERSERNSKNHGETHYGRKWNQLYFRRGRSVLSRPVPPEETEYLIGKYGMLRKSYLQEHRKGLYLELVLAGKLNEHLHQVEEECNRMMDRLVEQMKERQGVTEELKMQDQMAWVGRMNNIWTCVEEIELDKIVYR